MPIIQGGPPEWIWERTPDPIKCEVVSSKAPEGHVVYEVRITCGLDIMRLQFFTADELKAIASAIKDQAP